MRQADTRGRSSTDVGTLNGEDTCQNPFAALSNLGQFCSLHVASVHSTVFRKEYMAIESDGHN